MPLATATSAVQYNLYAIRVHWTTSFPRYLNAQAHPAAPRRVDDPRPTREARDLNGSDHPAGFWQKRHVEGQDLRARKQLVQGERIPLEGAGGVLRKQRVVPDAGHLERQRAPRDGAADLP